MANGFFQNATPEQRAAMQAEAAATRAANKAAAKESPAAERSPPPSVSSEAPLTFSSDQSGAGEPTSRLRYGLTPEERAEIRAEIRRRVAEEEKRRDLLVDKAAEREFFERELLLARHKAGLTDTKDDLIQYTVNMPPSHNGQTIDGVRYEPGQTYLRRRCEVECMMENAARAWTSEDLAGNPHKKFYKQEYSMRGGLVQNPNANFDREGDNFVFGRAGISGRTGLTVNAPDQDPVDAIARALR